VRAYTAPALIAALLFVGSPVAAPQTTTRSCFWTRTVRDFSSVDNQTVYVRAGTSNVWALELFARCMGVDWAHRAALRSRTGRVCEGRAIDLHIDVPSRGALRQRCLVDTVRKLTPAEVAALPSGAAP
jgi:hypothetical protein